MATLHRAVIQSMVALTLVLALAACEARGSVAGGGSDNGGGGRVKLDLPF